MKPNRTQPSQYSPAHHRVMNLFSTPFLRGHLPLNPKRIISDIDALVDQVAEKGGKDKLSDYTSYFDQEIREATHRLGWFDEFADIMKDTYIEFIRTQFHREVGHLSRHDIHLFAWINRYDSENQHDIHNHVDSYVSGTYYVNSSDRPIKFWNPNMAAQYAHNGREDKMEIDGHPNMDFTGCTGFQSEMYFHPTEGDFLLWPSYMMHSVPAADTNDSSDRRYSISFNLKHNDPIMDNKTGNQYNYGEIF